MKEPKGFQFRLSKQERQELHGLLRGGLQPVRTVLRALALRQLAEGQAIRKVAANVGLTPKTVWLTRQRYQQGGLERALYERARPGKAALLDARQRQRLIALVCSPPPQGRARWTVRLLAEEAVKRKLVPRVGRETVRVLLESHDLKPWREKNVVRGPDLGGKMKATSIITAARLLSVFCFLTGVLFGQTAAPPETVNGATAVQTDASAHPAPAAKAPPSAPRRRFVPVLISVTDGSGNPMMGLAKEQLTILDTNQAVQPLQLLKASDIPLHLGIVLLSSPASFSQQQAAAIDLVQKAIRPNVDEAFVVTARGKKPWPSDRLDWKQDPAELAKIIRGLDRDAGLPDAFNFEMKTDETGGDENRGRSTLQTYAGSGVTVFDAVYSMMNSDPRPSRRVLVIFREPWSHSPGFGIRATTAVEGQLMRVIGVAQEMHTTIFVVGLE